MRAPAVRLEWVLSTFANWLEPGAIRFASGSLLFFSSALLTLACGITIAWRERSNRIGALFLGLCAFLSLWGVLRGGLRLVVDPDLALQVGRYLYATVALMMPLGFDFNLSMMRRRARSRGLIRACWIIGVGIAVLSAGTDLVVDSVAQRSWGLEPQAGVLGALGIVWVACLFVVADLQLIRALRAAPMFSAERQRLLPVAWALALQHVAGLEMAVFLGLPFYPATYLVILLYVLLHSWVLWQYSLSDTSPARLADQIVAVMRGALLVVDTDCRVGFANPAAERMLGRRRVQMVGVPLSDVLHEEFDAEGLAVLAAGAEDGESRERELRYEAREGSPPIHLSMSVVPAIDAQRRRVGWIIYLRDVTSEHRSQQNRVDETLRDPLTGLPSRTSFMGLLDAAAQSVANNSGLRFGVACIGIDRFHVVNEDLGQRIGDQILIDFAQLLRDRLRPQDVVCRLGGDEFAVLVTNADDQRPERDFAEQLLLALKVPLQVAGHSVYLGASIGVVSSEAKLSEGGEVLRHAGIAMHRVKERGGGSAEFITESTGARQRTRLEAELRRAVEQREFVTYYQPVIDAQAQRIVGFEALVRWMHPQEGLLLPGRFIEFAEEIGLVSQIDQLVLEQACADICAFRAAPHGTEVTLNVNVDESELLRPDFTDDIRRLVDRSSARPEWLYLEILERSSLTQGGLDRLQRLADAGFRLCVDDFGTGYSSLSRLHELPIGTLKIDRSFVRGMLTSEGGQKVVRAIVLLAQTMGLRLVAEGVSAVEELRLLNSMGCRLYQGFYYSPAVPRDQALEWLEKGVCPVASDAAD